MQQSKALTETDISVQELGNTITAWLCTQFAEYCQGMN